MILNLSSRVLSLDEIKELSRSEWDYLKFLITTEDKDKLYSYLFQAGDRLTGVIVDRDCPAVVREVTERAKRLGDLIILKVL